MDSSWSLHGVQTTNHDQRYTILNYLFLCPLVMCILISNIIQGLLRWSSLIVRVVLFLETHTICQVLTLARANFFIKWYKNHDYMLIYIHLHSKKIRARSKMLVEWLNIYMQTHVYQCPIPRWIVLVLSMSNVAMNIILDLLVALIT